MNTKDSSPPVTLSIGSVERETGLPKDTLRVWERRYGFPLPVRDANGERAYTPEQVERLRLLKRLLDRGHRPGKIVGLAPEHLQVLVGEADRTESAVAAGAPGAGELEACLALCNVSGFDELRRRLSQDLMRLGLARFVTEVIAPLNVMVGAAWADGRLAVYEEHLYTESVQAVLRAALAAMPMQQAAGERRPRILLTTLPQEAHGLGLLMAEALFVLDGAHCISLGVQTPVLDIARAAQAHAVDIVALSFSAAMRGSHLRDGVQDLRSRLAPATEIWAGGSCAALQRRPPPEVRVVELNQIADALTAWRSAH